MGRVVPEEPHRERAPPPCGAAGRVQREHVKEHSIAGLELPAAARGAARLFYLQRRRGAARRGWRACRPADALPRQSGAQPAPLLSFLVSRNLSTSSFTSGSPREGASPNLGTGLGDAGAAILD